MVRQDPSEWFERGRQEALNVSIHCNKATVQEQVRSAIKHALGQYPHLEDKDFLKAYEELNEERLESEPDYGLYPELKGLKACHRERQRGFMEAARCTRAEMATFYNWRWYETHRLHTRFAGGNAADRSDGCTVVCFEDSSDGPIFGRNFDHPRLNIPIARIPDWTGLIHCPISSVPLCDEEPKEIFPADPFELMSEEIKGDIHQVVDFLKRYNEFWGPCNTIVIDTRRRAVTIEKANCRMGVIYPENGACYTTSFGYRDPHMHAYKLACDRKYMKLAGLTTDSPDWAYWRGCDRRLARLGQLVERETQAGPSLRGLGELLRDHAVPFPEAVCLAGEPADAGLWSVVSFATMLERENQRMLFSRVEDAKAAYAGLPYLVPGDGVEAREEWRPGTRAVPARAELSDAVLADIRVC